VLQKICNNYLRFFFLLKKTNHLSFFSQTFISFIHSSFANHYSSMRALLKTHTKKKSFYSDFYEFFFWHCCTQLLLLLLCCSPIKALYQQFSLKFYVPAIYKILFYGNTESYTQYIAQKGDNLIYFFHPQPAKIYVKPISN